MKTVLFLFLLQSFATGICWTRTPSGELIVSEMALWPLPTLAAEPSQPLQDPNPPAPTLISVQRYKTHADLEWTYKGPAQPDFFQVIRRIGLAGDRVVMLSALKHRPSISSDGTATYRWTDKKLTEGVTYTFSVMAIFEEDGGTSLESNAMKLSS